jgi:hypothetical protein
MSLELARVRLRGIYAVTAGLLLFVGLQLFVSVFLAPVGYLDAVRAISPKNGFAPLVHWIGQHPGSALAYRVIQLLPFLLAFPLPQTLRRVLPAPGSRISAVMARAGQLGFACYAVALLLGLFTSGSAAAVPNLTAGATTYADGYAVQSLISHVAGGLLISLSIVLTSVGIARSPLLPDWLGFAGLLPAGLLTATALQFAIQPTQVETSLSPLALVTLALWLVGIGIFLARLEALPPLAESPATGQAPTDPRADSDSNRDIGSAAATHQ